MSTLDEFAITRNSTFNSADIMRMLSVGFDISALVPARIHLTERTLVLIDKTRTLTLIDKERTLVLI